jgi:hypothetical protein
MELHESADAAHDWKTFLAFARRLLADRKGAAEKESADPAGPYDLCGADGWQNVTIEDFFEAAIAWAESTEFGRTQGLSPDEPWRQFAAFLYCGKIYE